MECLKYLVNWAPVFSNFVNGIFQENILHLCVPKVDWKLHLKALLNVNLSTTQLYQLFDYYSWPNKSCVLTTMQVASPG